MFNRPDEIYNGEHFTFGIYKDKKHMEINLGHDCGCSIVRLEKSELKELADFILKYLENK